MTQGALTNARALGRCLTATAFARASMVMVTLAALASPAAAQRQGGVLERANSAYDEGERARARVLYAEALAVDSSLSRAVFRLAQLEESPLRALALYRRYSVLEPRDPWGFMAQGDVLGGMGRYAEGEAAYARAASLAPGERDVALGRARLQLRAERPDRAIVELSTWTARHEDDGEAWDLLGRASLRAGRPRAAALAFAFAVGGTGGAGGAGGVHGAAEREALARSLAALAVERVAGYQRDSDGNRVSRLGGVTDAMVADGVRVGVGAERLTIGDGVTESSGLAAFSRISARPAPGVRVEVQGGVVRLANPAGGTGDWTTPQADARLRVRAPRGGASLELRAQRLALGTAPVLVANRVARTEGRATAEIPAGFLRLRAGGRVGRVGASGEAANTRLGAEGGVVAPLGDRMQLAAQYRWMGFERASLAGYFAPRRAETAETGVYFETGGDGPFSLAADLGGGAQRVAEQGSGVGRWSRALRAWGYGSVSLGAARALYAEVEAYDAPFAPEGVATSGTWRFVSVGVGVRWALQ